MPSKFLNISTDTTLGGSSASDSTVSSQKALKTYIDSQTGAAPAFANITGQPTDNTNLASALNAKYDASNPNGYQANVIETVKVNGTALTPSSKAVDITVPTVNNATLTITQGGTSKGTFTANASSDVTIALDSPNAIDNKSITTNSSSQIQAIGVINSRDTSTAIKTWTGTRSQYEELGTAYYAWYYSGDTVYTLSTTPSVGDHYYQYYGGEMHEASVQGNIGLVTYVGSGEISVDGENAYRYARTSSSDVTIGSNPIDSNTLYNITDTGEIYLGSTIISNYGADTGLSNLSSTGQAVLNAKQDVATAVNYNNISNCITEIQQDIKLELDNGTLTLKAGSKVYVPNGFEADGTTPKFDVITIVEDTSMYTWGSVTSSCMITRIPEGNIIPELLPNIYSGSTAPSGTTYMWWYDTANNIVKRTANGGSTWIPGSSLPLCYCYADNGAISRIDQVFNGFGYIGSTVFALPGIKGLIPNGRNADGTLKSIEFTVRTVQTFSRSNLNGYFCIMSNGKINYDALNYWTYDSDKNYFTHDESIIYFCHTVRATTDYTGVITSFTPKTAFHAVDYNDSSTISGWGMPSDRYIDLTLGASGSTYTAPANGYFFIYAINSVANGAIYMNDETGLQAPTPRNAFNGGTLGTCMPIKKNNVMKLQYDGLSSVIYFRFVYAEGENV